jgi:hypothetical protein
MEIGGLSQSGRYYPPLMFIYASYQGSAEKRDIGIVHMGLSGLTFSTIATGMYKGIFRLQKLG